MATQIVMDHTGDSRHLFNPADPAAAAEAKERFELLTDAVPNARVELLFGVGHVPPYEAAERTSELLLEFMANETLPTTEA